MARLQSRGLNAVEGEQQTVFETKDVPSPDPAETHRHELVRSSGYNEHAVSAWQRQHSELHLLWKMPVLPLSPDPRELYR